MLQWDLTPFFIYGNAVQKDKMWPRHATPCNDLVWV